MSLEQIDQYLARFTDWMHVKDWSPETLRAYDCYVRYFLRYLEQETSVMHVRDIDTALLLGYQSHLCTRKNRHGKPLSLSSQGTHISALKAFFQFLYETGFLLYNPAAVLKTPKRHRELPRGVMNEQEVEKLLNQANTETLLGFRNRTLLEVLYSTAIRIGELCRLTLQDTDLVQSRLVIRKTKTREDRVVPLGEIACDYVREYVTHIRPQLSARASVYGHEPHPSALFLSKSGKALRSEPVRAMVRDYNKRAGVTRHVTPHSFRHSCATHMLKHGADIRYIQELLGHRCIKSTQVYTHVEPVDLKKIHHQCHPRELQEFGHDIE